MNTEAAKSPILAGGLFAAAVLFFLKAIYVAIELVYNHTLMEFVGSRYLTEAQIENLEMFGRNLAATGLTLLLLRPILRMTAKLVDGLPNPRRYTILLVALSTSVVYGSTYLAQWQLIEHLAARATAEDRYDAYYLNMLRGMLARGDVTNKEFLPIREAGEALSIEDKLTLAVAPLAVSGDAELIARMRNQGGMALARYVREDALRTRFERDWSTYHDFQKQLATLWAGYKRGVTQATYAMEQADLSAARAYIDALTHVANGYNHYKRLEAFFLREKNKRLTDKNLQDLRTNLAMYFINKKWKNIKDSDPEYRRATEGLFGHVPPNPRRWCGPSLSGNGEACPGDFWRVKDEAEKIFDAAFRRNTKGFPSGLSPEQYLRHPAVGAIIAAQSSKNGLFLPKGYKGDFAPFAKAYREAAAERVRTEMNKAFKEVRGSFPFGLDAKDFLKHDVVQKELPEELRGYPLFLTMEEFFAKVWAPQAEKRINEGLTGLLPGNADKFNEGKWKEYGTEAVKLLYVLPLAMGLSVLFSLLNIATMIVAIMMLAYSLIRHRPPVRGAVAVAVVLLTVSLPFILHPGEPAEHVGVDQIMTQADSLHPVAGVATRWIVHGELATYGTGSGIVNSLPEGVQAKLGTLFGG